MIVKILNGLTNGLHKLLDCTVYIDKIPQKVKYPFLYITLLNSTEERIIDYRYKVSTSFLIKYVVDINKPLKLNLYDVAEKINDTTDVLTLEDGEKIIGINRENDIVDGNLESFVTYVYINYKEREKIKEMDTLEYFGGVKENE